jgi:hypothetical protein
MCRYQDWFFWDDEEFTTSFDYEMEHPGSWQDETYQEKDFPALMGSDLP